MDLRAVCPFMTDTMAEGDDRAATSRFETGLWPETVAETARSAFGVITPEEEAERLAAREKISEALQFLAELDADVLSLQDILSNKQTRGAFGEIQLQDIVRKAMPPGAFSFQATLSNGKRADCLIHLPNPPGPIVIDGQSLWQPWSHYPVGYPGLLALAYRVAGPGPSYGVGKK